MVAVYSEAVDEAGSIATLGALRRGSGVVIGDDGLVLTIGYLILEAERVDLVVEGARRVPARVVAYDLASGFGLLQALAPLRVAPVALGRSTSASGDEPLMVASGGAEGELSLARLVSQRAFSGYWEYHIDAALFTVPPRTDHSGAGLFNLDGELLGIGSLVVSDAMGPAAGRLPGNMFVPVDLLKPILAEMRARGASRSSTRAWLGLNCAESEGEVRVLRVTRESPAELAGVLPGDRILRIDGAEVGALETLYKTLWRDGAERDVQLTIRRGGDVQTLTVHALDRMKTLRKPQGI
jgi:S1-C subfamily serine protease